MEEGEVKKKKTYVFPMKLQFPELYRSDVSVYPSYTQLHVPYSATCGKRYLKSTKDYRRQLLKELHSMSMMHDRAIEGVRLRRVFSIGLKLPRHAAADPLTPNERRRLETLLKEE